jgi:hypothetical protein
MLFGSVPSPPRKPVSWTSTQSARQNRIPNHSAYLTRRGRPVRKIAPIAASAMTTTRLTVKPWRVASVPNAETRDERKCGCGVPDIVCTIPDRVPGLPSSVPCQ